MAHMQKGDLSRGKASFLQLIEARQQAGDKAGEMELWLRLATSAYCNDCREQLGALNKALSLSRQLGDQPKEALFLLEMGYQHLNARNPRQAESEALKALAIQKRVGYPALCRTYHQLAGESVYNLPVDWVYLSNAYYLLADANLERGALDKMLFYILEAVKSVEGSGITDELDYAYYRLGNAYYDLGRFDKSVEYYQKSLGISHRKGEVFVHIGLPRRMVVALLKRGKAGQALRLLQDITRRNLPLTYEKKMIIAQSMGSCYSALKQYKMAEQYYLKGVAWSKRSSLQMQYTAWQRISQFYVENARYAEADGYLKRLAQVAGGQIIPSHRLEVYLMQFKVDSALGNYTAAIRHFRQYTSLKDSLFNDTKSKQLAQLSLQYDMDKKEQALKLKEKDIALLSQQSKAQRSQRNALLGGTTLLLALLGLGYNRFRLKQRSNRQLQLQQQLLQQQHEELRVQQKVLQAQKDVLQAQQEDIKRKNEHLSALLTEKDTLLGEKEHLLKEKDSLLLQKDSLLTEKERLLKEIHHRVKNNLQVVMSLLNSQADCLQDKEALTAIQESQHRVQAMALIHQKLYQTQGIARIPMHDYIEEVVAYLSASYYLHQQVRFCLEVEPIELDVTQAVPLGLIINEAITNACKYAFPGGRPGTVSLSLRRVTEYMVALSIADDGVGLPEGFDSGQSRSLGMTLLHGFSAQLGGELTITGRRGLSIQLLFEEEQFEKAYA
jgi:two-component sensor histidine kinase